MTGGGLHRAPSSAPSIPAAQWNPHPCSSLEPTWQRPARPSGLSSRAGNRDATTPRKPGPALGPSVPPWEPAPQSFPLGLLACLTSASDSLQAGALLSFPPPASSCSRVGVTPQHMFSKTPSNERPSSKGPYILQNWFLNVSGDLPSPPCSFSWPLRGAVVCMPFGHPSGAQEAALPVLTPSSASAPEASRRGPHPPRPHSSMAGPPPAVPGRLPPAAVTALRMVLTREHEHRTLRRDPGFGANSAAARVVLGR